MCRADVPRVPEQFPEAGETHSTGLGRASPRIARPAVKTRAGVPFVDTLGVTNRVPPPIDARVCRRSLSRPRNGGRDLSGRREVSSSTFESPEAAQTKTLNPGFVGSQTPLPRRAVIRSTAISDDTYWTPASVVYKISRDFLSTTSQNTHREIDLWKYLQSPDCEPSAFFREQIAVRLFALVTPSVGSSTAAFDHSFIPAP